MHDIAINTHTHTYFGWEGRGGERVGMVELLNITIELIVSC